MQIFWSQVSSSSAATQSLQEFRHVLPARHLSYRVDDLRLDTIYLIQVYSAAFWYILPFSEIFAISVSEIKRRCRFMQ